MKSKTIFVTIATGLLSLWLIAALPAPMPQAQTDNPNPPGQPVKLIFIHHSTGENWLTDGYGDLGRTLGENNYFVSDTNYGWGPDGIGDNTDIPNWMEWFRSAETPTYMNALFNESGQNSYYPRMLSDPGGENQIIMFKSCFPNSELSGNPNDPPGTYEDMSVGGAKYVYNQLLQYFVTRPDKLFVVITAPPLSDPTYAANARAFNQWLVNDWLRENNYMLNNVGVFDFYNVLTSPDAHHRYNTGRVEHVTGGGNSLHYSSGDDHPSEAGSRKATEEFVSLLNVFYNRWRADVPLQPAPEPAIPSEESPQHEINPAPLQTASLIDNFEAGNPPGTNGWESFWDEGTPTSMHCAAETGSVNNGGFALYLDFNVAPEAWATCAIFYDSAQNWSSGEGISFYLHAAQIGLVFNVDLYAGNDNEEETYLYTIEAPPESANGWILISLRWEDFHRADWEAGAGTPFAKPDQIMGMAFGFDTYEGTSNTGKLWVDDLSLLSGDAPIEAPPPATQPSDAVSEPALPSDESPGRPSLLCGGAVALPIGLVTLAFWQKKRHHV